MGRESIADTISKWMTRIHMSKAALEERVKVRSTFNKWYRTKFHGGRLALEEKDIANRQVNIPLAFSRSIQSALYSHDPDVKITSPWLPSPSRVTMGLAATRLLQRIGMRPTAKKVLLDCCLGGFGVMRVGYQNAMSWSQQQEARQRRMAREDAQALMAGEDVLAQKGQDHAVHVDELTQVAREWLEQQLQAPELFEALQRLIRSHTKMRASTEQSAVDQDSSQSVWAARVPLVLDGEPAFGWDPDCAFEDAAWCWMRWRRPLAQVKANPYYKNTRDLTGTSRRAEGMLPSVGDGNRGDWLASQPTGVLGDIELVDGVDVVDRSTGRWLAYVEGESRFLFNEVYPSGDLFQRAGFHKFSLVDDPDDGPGLTPLEAAAGQIITINMGEGVRALLMSKSKPVIIADERVIGQDGIVKITQTEIGEVVVVRPADQTRPITNAFAPFPQPALSNENFGGILQARGDLAKILGPGEARMGGGEQSKTATAASVVAESTSEFFTEWSARFEGTMAEAVGDLLQLAKAYYEPDDIVDLVGPEMVRAWPDFRGNAVLLSKREVVRVDAGASMPGRKEGEMRRLAELTQLLAGHPLMRQRELLTKIVRLAGFDPEELMLSRQEEQEMAQKQTETSGGDLHGGPETQAQAAADAGGQSSEDINNAMRQKAATAGRQAQAAQQR